MGQMFAKLIRRMPRLNKLLPIKSIAITRRNPSSSISTSPRTASRTPGNEKEHILLPAKSWDSHMHVLGDLEQYPIAKSAVYTPTIHTLSDAQGFETSIGVETIVLVQPSIYGTDNSCLLDALRTLGVSARGVVVIDPDTMDVTTLKQWHKLGVRGIRVNFKSVERSVGEEELEQELRRYADIVRPLGWVLQLYINMSILPLLERIVGCLDVKICLDHFACPDLKTARLENRDPYLLSGFDSLIRLLDGGKTWIKISADYRLANSLEDTEMLSAMVKEFRHGLRRKRIIWASDWPHTRFEGHDVHPFIKRCLDWCDGDAELRENLFRDNARELWG